MGHLKAKTMWNDIQSELQKSNCTEIHERDFSFTNLQKNFRLWPHARAEISSTINMHLHRFCNQVF